MTGLAILGCGYVANMYRLTLPMHPELRIVGAYDHETARTETMARLTGAKAYPDMAALLDDPRVQCTGVAKRVVRDATARAMPRSAPGLMDQLILADYRANQCTVATFDRELAKADRAQLVA